MSSIHIRRAQLADAKQLSDLICENVQKLLKPHYNDEQWHIFIRYYSEQVLREKIAAQAVFFAQIKQ